MISTESTSNSKLWKKINPFINPNKRSMIDHFLFSSKNPMFTAQDMVNMFSNFFSSILNNITFCSIVKSTDYINQHLSTQEFASKLENISPFSFNEISIEKVSKSLLELDENSSAGSIGIKTIVLTGIIRYLYSLNSSTYVSQPALYPTIGKSLNVSPILKADRKLSTP